LATCAAQAEGLPARVVQLVEVDAVDVLLNDVGNLSGRTDVERPHHVRAVDPRHQSRLGHHPLSPLLGRPTQLSPERFDDHRGAEHDVSSEPDVAHTAAAEASPDLVVADALAG
jgi:hypothetical protein